MNPVTDPCVKEYLENLLPVHTGLLARLETMAQAQQIPVILPEVAALIEVLIKTTGSRRILEVGTAIGYSAILFATAAGSDSQVITIERAPHFVDLARQHIEEAGLAQRIKVMPGDALEVLPQLTKKVDLIFLDGAKGHYLEMLAHCLTLLKPGGLLISDNILYKGMVTGEHPVQRRQKTIVTRMRSYLETISHHPQLHTSLLSIGDGLAVSFYMPQEEEGHNE